MLKYSKKLRVIIYSTVAFVAIACMSGSLAYAEGGLNGIEQPTQQVQTQAQTESKAQEATVKAQQPTQNVQGNTTTSKSNKGVDNHKTIQNNGITNSNKAVSSSNKEAAEAVSGMFKDTALNNESIKKASTFTAPLANLINTVAAFVLGFASLGIFLITALDLLYIGFPPIRGILSPGGASSGGMASGGGGFGGGYGGFGGGGFGGGGFGGGMSRGASGGSSNASGMRWVSDEAMAVVAGDEGNSSGGGGFGGGFGGGMMGGASQSQPQGSKSKILAYLKKRSFFLAMFGVCVLLFSTTVFTDLGIKLGMWLLQMLTGVTNSIPV